MQHRGILIVCVTVASTALLLSWRPWPGPGRYQLFPETEKSSRLLLDTQTGRIWALSPGFESFSDPNLKWPSSFSEMMPRTDYVPPVH